MRDRSTRHTEPDSPRAGTRSTKEDAYPDGEDGQADGPEGDLKDPEGLLKSPHERDQSTGSMAPGADRASGQRAYDDLAAGRTDTDLRGSAREIIERAQQEDSEAGSKHQQAVGKPASGETPPEARPASRPIKE